jgi:AbrB family looped-hinge helix DNA binding protein
MARVQEKGQVTIPQAVRKALGLRKGDMVTFVQTESGIEIRRAEVVVQEALQAIGATLKSKGIRLEDMVERGRSIRQDLIEEMYGLR